MEFIRIESSQQKDKNTFPDVGTKPFARMHWAFGFLVSKEIVVLRRRESETKIWFYQTSS